MRWGKSAFVMALSFSFSVQAQDNVMVDLSVLDELSPSYTAPSEPMFPVLPERAIKPVKTTNKVVPQPKISKKKKAEEKKKDIVVEQIAPIPAKKEVLPVQEEIVVVDVEPAEAPAINEKANVLQAEPQVVEEKTDVVIQEAPKTDSLLVEPAPIKSEEPSPLNTTTNEDVFASTKTSADSDVVESAPTNIVIEDTTAYLEKAKPVSKSIVFEEGISELDSDQMSQIDDIIGRFADLSTNKVAIYSYNVDNGVDTFKKKRISLKRAIEIRSYLLRQGYKNFSIKVININEGSNKANTVELEEIKKM